jgi:hypothetical protein
MIHGTAGFRVEAFGNTMQGNSAPAAGYFAREVPSGWMADSAQGCPACVHASCKKGGQMAGANLAEEWETVGFDRVAAGQSLSGASGLKRIGYRAILTD